MKKNKMLCSALSLLAAAALCLTMVPCAKAQMPGNAGTALLVKALNAKRVEENPYMAKSDANIHHDGYNTDSTDEILPLGISQKSMSPTKKPMQMPLRLSISTASAMLWCRCSAALPSAT